MQVHYGLENGLGIRNPVVTTGSFDGVHVGHQVILNRLKRLAREINGESVLISFHPHPRKVLYPESAGKELLLINSQREKIELLRNTKLDHLIIVNFTIEFSKTSSVDFIRKILVGKLDARRVIVGFNHHFGHNREGDYEYLRELGRFYNFQVEEIPEQDIDNETVSSTKIRKALLEGNIQRANAYLDHHYMVMGELKPGTVQYGQKGLPTMKIQIEEECKLIPPDGIYAVHLISGSNYYRGMTIIRRPEPFAHDSRDISVDTHLINYEGRLIGQTATLFVHKQIRNFPSSGASSFSDTDFTEAKEVIEELIY